MSKVQKVRESFRNKIDRNRQNEAAGFVGGGLTMGFFGPNGKNALPDEVGGIDTEMIIGGVLLAWGLRGDSRNRALARGVGYVGIAGGIKDIGAMLANRF